MISALLELETSGLCTYRLVHCPTKHPAQNPWLTPKIQLRGLSPQTRAWRQDENREHPIASRQGVLTVCDRLEIETISHTETRDIWIRAYG